MHVYAHIELAVHVHVTIVLLGCRWKYSCKHPAVGETLLGGVKVRELEKKDIEVKEEIAVGKSGKVFKGHWSSQDKTIAVKIVISEETVIREVCTQLQLHFCLFIGNPSKILSQR